MPTRPDRGRALFYTRDSAGRSEIAPAQYVPWAIRRAAELGLRFSASPEQVDRMIRDRVACEGDVFLDLGISGNVLNRPGLEALKQEARRDSQVSHLLIPRRDRLVRPDQAVEGYLLEVELRQQGLWIIYQSQDVRPLNLGRREDLGTLLTGILEFDQSGRFRLELAEKLTLAKLCLAQMGFSIGGSAPYGFERWLVLGDAPVRQLNPGEYVRQAGHHVRWLPTALEKLNVVRRIFRAIEEGRTASAIARQFQEEGIPPPGIDHRRTHRIWHATTVRNIARNKLYVGLMEYNRRGMGDQLRLTPEGPRPLEPNDFGPDNRKRTVVNPPERRLTAEQSFEKPVAPEVFARVQVELDRRSATQRGKPRARGNRPNPLGGRAFDLSCGWPLYRTPRKRLGYTCGLYQQSHAKLCEHNTFPGQTGTRLLLDCIRQRVLVPGFVSRLQDAIRRIAEEESHGAASTQQRDADEKRLRTLERDLEKVTRNLALAETDEESIALRGVFHQSRAEKEAVAARLAVPAATVDEGVVTSALQLLEQLPALADDESNLQNVQELFEALDLRVYVQFATLMERGRKVNRVTGGVVTFGSTPPPVPLYRGPTDRAFLNEKLRSGEVHALLAGSHAVVGGTEEDSSGNVQRGTRRCT